MLQNTNPISGHVYVKLEKWAEASYNTYKVNTYNSKIFKIL